MLATIGSSLCFIERLKDSLTKTTKSIKDHNTAGRGCTVMLPNTQLMLTMPTGTTVTVEGKPVPVYAPRGLIQGSEDEMAEMLAKTISSVRHAVQVVRPRLLH